jgi:hypothetical protein
MEDDSTMFTDIQLGYQMVLPPEWLVVPADGALQAELVAEADGQLKDSLLRLIETNFSQEGLRLFAYDYTARYRYLEENYIGNISISFDENVNPESELQDILIASVSSFEELYEESDIVYQSIEENSSGVSYARMIVSHPTGVFGVPLKQVFVTIKLDAGVLVITSSIHDESYIDAERSLKSVFNSIEFLD